MARPKKTTVDYFPHVSQHKSTIFILEQKYGNDGYAFWFKILELLATTEGHYLDCNDMNKWEFLKAKTLLADSEEKCIEILNLLAKLKAIDKSLWDNRRIIWSQNFIDGIADVYRNRKMPIPKKPRYHESKPTQGVIMDSNNHGGAGISTDDNRQIKVNKSKVNKSKVNTPAGDNDHRNLEVQEIIDYAKTKNFSIQGSEKVNRRYVYNLLRKKDPGGNPLGMERLKKLIDYAVAAQGEPFAPTINDFKALFYRWQDLLSFMEKKKNGGRIG